jgi:hypothetical protein
MVTERFSSQEPQPGQDPLVGDRAFNDAYSSLAGFDALQGDSRFVVRDNDTPHDVGLYQVDPSMLANLTDMPTKAAELPPAV